MEIHFSFKTAAVFLTLLMTGAPAIMGRPKDLFDKSLFSQTCDTVSFTLQNDGTRSVRNNQGLFQCNSLSSSSLPSGIHLQPNSVDCSYRLITYSGSGCRDDSKVNVVSLNYGRSSVTLGGQQRKSVCSYKLGSNFPHSSGRSVFVKFGGGNVDMVVHELNRRGCNNICGSRNERFLPQWAGVYDRAGFIDYDNYIELFSEPNCADGRQIRFENGKTNIHYERLDQIGHGQGIGSFMFLRERSSGKSLGLDV